MRRLIVIAVVALGLAPGTWLRDASKADDLRPLLHAEDLDAGRGTAGQLSVEGVWHLTSPNTRFHGYSGIAAIAPDDLLAISDMGHWLRFAPPGNDRLPRFGDLARVKMGDKRQVDAESVTYDPASRHIWIGYEGTNTIERSGLAMAKPKRAKPESMRGWWDNSGPEAMARLPDGRFLVIGEGSEDWFGEGKPALLFDRDPVEDGEPLQFGFSAPEGFSATDIAPLRDGRVLILMRKIEGVIPPRFSAKIALADPAQIERGKEWQGQVIATIEEPMPSDNFEGLAAVPRRDGSYTLWMISDDNGAALQRTLLYRLHWAPQPPAAKRPPGG